MEKKNPSKVALLPEGSGREGGIDGTRGGPFQYGVTGLPSGANIKIIFLGGSWRTWRVGSTEIRGNYNSPEDALVDL